MRKKLLEVLHAFNANRISFQLFQWELEQLNGAGIWQCLEDSEKNAFREFFTWYVGMYTPSPVPNNGPLERLRRWWRGDVTLDDVRRKAQELESLMI